MKRPLATINSGDLSDGSYDVDNSSDEDDLS